jgi:NAD(P)H dehydrogenase (quinone)
MAFTVSKIMVILANPEYDQDNRSNLVSALCKTFIEGVQKKGISVDLLELYKDDEFNPIFDPEEKDTKALEYQIRLKKVQMVVIFHPVWWSLFPAILKGFLDKVFTSGFAFETRKSVQKGLLSDKFGLVFCTDERPTWEERFLYRNMLKNFWQKIFFRTLGMSSKFYHFGSMRTVSDEEIAKWHKKVEKIANSINSKDSLLDLI